MTTRTSLGALPLIVLAAVLPAQEITWAGLPELAEKAPAAAALALHAESVRARQGGLRRSFSPRLEAGGFLRSESDMDGEDAQFWGNLIGSASTNLWRGGRDSALSKSVEAEARAAAYSARSGRLRLLRELRLQFLRANLAERMSVFLGLSQEETSQDREKAKRKVVAGMTSPTDILEFDLVEMEIQLQKAEADDTRREALASISGLVGLMASGLAGFDAWPAPPVVSTRPKGLDTLAAEAEALARDQEALSQRRWLLPSIDLGLSARRNRDNGGVDSENEVTGFLGLDFQLWDGGEARALAQSLEAQAGSLKRLAEGAESERAASLKMASERIGVWTSMRPGLEARLEVALNFRGRVSSEYLRGVKDGRDLESSTRAVFEARAALERVRAAAWGAWIEMEWLASGVENP